MQLGKLTFCDAKTVELVDVVFACLFSFALISIASLMLIWSQVRPPFDARPRKVLAIKTKELIRIHVKPYKGNKYQVGPTSNWNTYIHGHNFQRMLLVPRLPGEGC